MLVKQNLEDFGYSTRGVGLWLTENSRMSKNVIPQYAYCCIQVKNLFIMEWIPKNMG